MDIVYGLLEKKNKEKEKLNNEDKEKLKLINIMLKSKDWIYSVDPNTAVTILTFLGVKESNALNFYMNMLTNSDKTNEYILVDDINSLLK